MVDLSFMKMSVLPTIYGFNVIPIKALANYFIFINELIPKFIQRGKRPSIANTNLKTKDVWRQSKYRKSMDCSLSFFYIILKLPQKDKDF